MSKMIESFGEIYKDSQYEMKLKLMEDDTYNREEFKRGLGSKVESG